MYTRKSRFLTITPCTSTTLLLLCHLPRQQGVGTPATSSQHTDTPHHTPTPAPAAPVTRRCGGKETARAAAHQPRPRHLYRCGLDTDSPDRVRHSWDQVARSSLPPQSSLLPLAEFRSWQPGPPQALQRSRAGGLAWARPRQSAHCVCAGRFTAKFISPLRPPTVSSRARSNADLPRLPFDRASRD